MRQSGPRIGLVHATPLAIKPAAEAFAAHWPEAWLSNFLDESLQSDAANTDYDGPAFSERIVTLAKYHAACGAVGLLFTCSAFSEAIKAAGRALDVPVLRPDEAAIERALSLGKPVRILCTFQPTVRVINALVREFRDTPAQTVEIEMVDGALSALRKGDPARHDALIAEAAGRASEPVIVLGQYSMARAASAVEKACGRAPFVGPAHAVRMLKELVEARG